jgi:acyl dehydratase
MSQQSSGTDTPFSTMTGAWTRMASTMFRTAAAANCATAAALSENGDGPGDRLPGAVESVTYDEVDWTFERTVSDPHGIGVGDTVRFSKVLDDDDVHGFANVSGDTNRLHLDDDFAATTRFKGRIAPGLTIYLSQDLEFRAPVQIGERVTAVVEVVEALGNGKFRLVTTVECDDKVLVDGEATVLVDEFPE